MRFRRFASNIKLYTRVSLKKKRELVHIQKILTKIGVGHCFKLFKVSSIILNYRYMSVTCFDICSNFEHLHDSLS